MGYKNYNKMSKPSYEERDEEIITQEIEETAEPIIQEIEETVEPITGTVTNCEKLNVREEPDRASNVIVIITKGTKVMIDEAESTNDFYKVYTEAGIEGFCMKDFISI